MGRRWGGMVLGAAMMLAAAGLVQAQDQDSKDQDIETIKKRLDALEKEKQERDAKDAQNQDSGSHGADPADAKWYDRVHVGGGVRSSFRMQSEQAPNGRTNSMGFQLDSGRLYSGGQITDTISATLNAEFTGSPSVLDAIAEFKFRDEFNIFAGRLLPACDRANSDGPYYNIAWDFPETSITFNNATNGFGREDGVTFWGDVQHFKYWAGAYTGLKNTTLSADHLQYAARAQYDFWDQEKGYYLSSTYHGGKEILALGAAVNFQSSTSGTVADTKNTLNFEVDALFEKKFEFGVPTVEVVYYYYSRGGYGGNGLGTFGNGNATTGPAEMGQGQAFTTTVAWLIPHMIGCGEFQPLIRYQGYDERSTDATKNPFKNNYDRWDVGLNYVISGHNARIALIYSFLHHKDAPLPTSEKSDHLLTLGSQVQF
jgi:hypothetical protein